MGKIFKISKPQCPLAEKEQNVLTLKDVYSIRMLSMCNRFLRVNSLLGTKMQLCWGFKVKSHVNICIFPMPQPLSSSCMSRIWEEGWAVRGERTRDSVSLAGVIAELVLTHSLWRKILSPPGFRGNQRSLLCWFSSEGEGWASGSCS